MIVSSRDYAPRLAGTNQPFNFASSGRGVSFGPNNTVMCADAYWGLNTGSGFGVYLSYDLGKSWLKSATVPTPYNFTNTTALGGCAYGKITDTQMGWAVTAPGSGVAHFIDTPSSYDANGFPKPEAWTYTQGETNLTFVDIMFDPHDDYWYCAPAETYTLRRRRLGGYDTWTFLYPPAGGICGGQASKGNGEAVVVGRDSGTVCWTPNLAAPTPTWTEVYGVLDTFNSSEQWGSVAYANGLWVFVGYSYGTTVYCTDPLNPDTYKQAWGPGTTPGLYTIATNGTLWLAANGQSNNPSIVEITVDTRDNAVIGSLPPGTYQGVQLVVLTPIFGNEVRYTLDGSTPTASSPLYTGPLRITTSTTIKALAVYDGELSPVTELVYIVTNADIVPLDYKASIMPLLIHQYQKDLA